MCCGIESTPCISLPCQLRFSINDARRNLKISTGSQGSHNPLQEFNLRHRCGIPPPPTLRSKKRGGYALDEKVCSFRRTHPRFTFVKGLTFNCGSSPLHIQWRGPKIKRDLLATPFQYLFLVYCSVEKLMHQRPNPIHFLFQREMARVKKMELCVGKLSFI